MRGIKQTAGRDRLGQFAPDFAQLNDDVLFGQIWADESLDLKTRSTIVICVFMGRGLVDDSLRYHLETAKKNGITREENICHYYPGRLLCRLACGMGSFFYGTGCMVRRRPAQFLMSH